MTGNPMAPCPYEGESYLLGVRVFTITAVNETERTACGYWADTLDAFGNYDREHDLPWETFWGMELRLPREDDWHDPA